TRPSPPSVCATGCRQPSTPCGTVPPLLASTCAGAPMPWPWTGWPPPFASGASFPEPTFLDEAPGSSPTAPGPVSSLLIPLLTGRGRSAPDDPICGGGLVIADPQVDPTGLWPL